MLYSQLDLNRIIESEKTTPAQKYAATMMLDNMLDVEKASKAYGKPRKQLMKLLRLGKRSSQSTQDEEEDIHIEQIAKYYDMTYDECIQSLTKIVDEYPHKIITRNFYRNETLIADSSWTKYFGTFDEFKRQARVIGTREVQKLERHIAKHASQDHLSRLTDEKQSYEGKYEKPSNGNRFKTIIKVSDTHGNNICPFYRKVVLATIKEIQPDIICHQGDAYEMSEFSQYTVDPREWDIVSDIQAGNDFFRDIRLAAPHAQIDFIESNHDYRLLRHLAEATPAMRAILSDLHGFTFASLLKIDQYKINYIGRSNLKAFSKRDIKTELGKNWKVYYDCSFVSHGHEKEIPNMHGTIGHTHKYKVIYGYDHVRGAYGIHYLGYGATHGDEYTNQGKYQKGFMIETIDTLTKKVYPQYIDLTNGFCNVAGKYYEDDQLLM